MAQTLEAPTRQRTAGTLEQRQEQQVQRTSEGMSGSFLTGIAAWAGLVGLTALAWTQGLFFSELLTVTCILSMVGLIRIMASKSEVSRTPKNL